MEAIGIKYAEVAKISEVFLLPLISELYGLKGYKFTLIENEVGRNVVYLVDTAGVEDKILRISFLNDRSYDDFQAELEYVRYLFDHSASVADVVVSAQGKLLEEITHNDHTYYISLFKKVTGKKMVENHYQYREGVPITEYYFNCGKTLGKLHQLSKAYTPVHSRHHFLDKFNAKSIDKLIPDSLSLLKQKLLQLLTTLMELDRDQDAYGMIHFDFNDGNYSINFDNGHITVYDFDNSCFGWYMYDLADVWRNGTGWVQFEPDPNRRKQFMEDYFKIVLEGYKSETSISDDWLAKLPLFIQMTLLENIIEHFNEMHLQGEEFQYEEHLAYLIKCMEEDIPYMGFFDSIYNCESPFEYEEELPINRQLKK